MTTYNGELYLREQLDSILPQLKADDEIIVGDDGSRDDTISILRSYNDNRIKIYNHNFHNHILNFEKTLSLCTGDYIFLCDQDDVWYDNKISTLLPYLEKYDLVCSNCLVTNGHPLEEGKLFFDGDASRRSGFVVNLWHNKFLGCCLAFRKSVLDRALPFPKGLITHDTWLGLVAEVKGKTRFIEAPLMYYRRHGANISSTSEPSRLKVSEMIKYRLTLLKGILNNFVIKRNKNLR